ncbi:MAG: hypothetical protein KF819_28535 [Labilithrix sp.]|nr:hypothetical protein [Labilithrix sp.]
MWWPRREARVVQATPTSDGMLLVRETRAYRELVEVARNTTVLTRVMRGDPLRSGFAYTDALHVAVAFGPRRSMRALCIGAGGGIVPRQLAARGIAVDVVERSPEVLDLAARHFGLTPGPLVSIQLAEARSFVRDTRAEYDAAIVDVAVTNEPSPLLLAPTFWRDLRRVLRDGSAVTINVMGALDGSVIAGELARDAIARAMGTTLWLPMLADGERADVRALRNFVGVVVGRATVSDDAPSFLPRLPAAIAEVARRLRGLAEARDHLRAPGDPELGVEPAELVAHRAR